jgi:hypothetical protein
LGRFSKGFGVDGEMITTGTDGKIGVVASFQLAERIPGKLKT